jgi:6-phosphogluconolactonase
LWAFDVKPGGSADKPTPILEAIGDPVEVGSAPVHLSLDVLGKFVFVANYVEGSLAAVPVNSEDGSLGPVASKVFHFGNGTDPERQEAPHVHGTFVAPKSAVLGGDGSGVSGGSVVYAMDLGLDRIFWYDFDPTTGLLVNGTGGSSSAGDDGSSTNYAWAPLGSGPRHMVLQPVVTTTKTTVDNEEGVVEVVDGVVAHVICELSSTIVSFAVDPATGALTDMLSVVSTLPEDADTSTLSKAAEILLSDDSSSSNGERYVYASNRGSGYGSDSVAVFSADGSTGALSPIQFAGSDGSFPRGMSFLSSSSPPDSAPNGDDQDSNLFLVVGGQDSNSVAVFRVDPETGLIDDSSPKALASNISSPVTFFWE